MFRQGDTIYCEAAADQEAIENAKQFIFERGYTQEQVKIVRSTANQLTSVVWR